MRAQTGIPALDLWWLKSRALLAKAAGNSHAYAELAKEYLSNGRMKMATILAYTSPALGHLLPISALLSELATRGHTIHVRTLSTGAEVGQRLGFHTDAIDARIEQIELDDWKGTNPLAALKLSVPPFARRAAHEVPDFADAVARVNPDALLVDVNSWGALSSADAGDIPWACFAPYTPPLRAPGVPPFGLGLKPLSGVLGRVRDTAVRIAVLGMLERVMLPSINAIRADVGGPPVSSMGEFLRRAPLILFASAKPFQYPNTDWGDAVQMIGPCVLDPGPDAVPDWLTAIELPIVLVTTSSEKQADTDLAATAMTALAEERVHIVATMPATQADGLVTPRNATVCRFVPLAWFWTVQSVRSRMGGWGDAKRTRAWRTGLRSAVRARPIRGRATRRGGAVCHPSARQEVVTVATAHEGAGSDDHAERCATGGSGARRHGRHSPRRRPV